jgi:hypothetical protein
MATDLDIGTVGTKRLHCVDHREIERLPIRTHEYNDSVTTFTKFFARSGRHFAAYSPLKG